MTGEGVFHGWASSQNYTSAEFKQHTKSKGTVHRLSVHEVHGQNDVPERARYTLLDAVRTLLSASGLRLHFGWRRLSTRCGGTDPPPRLSTG